MASSDEYPYNRSAPAFQLVMIPAGVVLMIASSADSTMAARFANASSARFCSVISCRSDKMTFSPATSITSAERRAIQVSPDFFRKWATLSGTLPCLLS